MSHVRTDACGDGSAGSSISRECFSQQYVEAACDVLAREPIYYYGVTAVLWSDPAACRAATAADEASYAADLAPDGPLAFDPVAAASCLDLLHRGYFPNDDAALVCRRVYFAPDATVGSPCVRYECATGARCEVFPDCSVGRCVALSPPGTACSGSYECASSGAAIGLCVGTGISSHCVQWIVEDAPLGGACDPTAPLDGVLHGCAPLLACVAGVCAPATPHPLGDDCSGSGWCAPGRYCTVSLRCETPVVLSRGAPCVAAGDRSAGAFCDIAAGLACDLVSHTCEPLGDGSAGAPCGGGASVATDVCRAGLLCVDGRCVNAPACAPSGGTFAL